MIQYSSNFNLHLVKLNKIHSKKLLMRISETFSVSALRTISFTTQCYRVQIPTPRYAIYDEVAILKPV